MEEQSNLDLFVPKFDAFKFKLGQLYYYDNRHMRGDLFINKEFINKEFFAIWCIVWSIILREIQQEWRVCTSRELLL